MARRASTPVVVTGAAGFIGFHVARLLLDDGHAVVGVDNMSDYYDVRLKRARLDRLVGRRGFTFHKIDLADRVAVSLLFERVRPPLVAHLAAQPGVRYSLENPHAYIDSNIAGFLNVLEGCRAGGAGHLVYASSSSVYGNSREMPFRTDQSADRPVSLYAASKRSNELMAHAYSHTWDVPVTGLRFFTVYGPWGRPDMAAWLFTRAIRTGAPIKVFNNGDLRRDFTCIDDIARGVVRVLLSPQAPDHRAGNGRAPRCRLYNIGNGQPVRLLDFIETLERLTGVKAVKEFLPMQPGDVLETCADTTALARDFGFEIHTPLEEGLRTFVEWFDAWHAG